MKKLIPIIFLFAVLSSIVFAQVEVKTSESSSFDSCVNACINSKRCIFTQEYPGREPPQECKEEYIKEVCNKECSQDSEKYKPYVPKLQPPVAQPQPATTPKGSTWAVPAERKIEVPSTKTTESVTRAGPVQGGQQTVSEQKPAEPAKSEAQPGMPAEKVEVEDQTTRLLGIVIKLEETSIGLEQTGKRLDAIGIYYAQNDQIDKANAFFEAKKQITELSQQLRGLKDLVKENLDTPEKVYPVIKERTQYFRTTLKAVVRQLLEKI